MFFEFGSWKENLIVCGVLGIIALIAYFFEKRKK